MKIALKCFNVAFLSHPVPLEIMSEVLQMAVCGDILLMFHRREPLPLYEIIKARKLEFRAFECENVSEIQHISKKWAEFGKIKGIKDKMSELKNKINAIENKAQIEVNSLQEFIKTPFFSEFTLTFAKNNALKNENDTTNLKRFLAHFCLNLHQNSKHFQANFCIFIYNDECAKNGVCAGIVKEIEANLKLQLNAKSPFNQGLNADELELC